MQQLLARDSAQGRWVLTAAVLGSGMALLDGTVVNIALRSMGEDLSATVSQLQWVVNAYLLSLASLILVGGSLGDRLGRRRMFMVGVAWFATASALCALAQGPNQLILARLVQGIGAALLTPGSLAMIQGSFRARDRASVIGRWAGLGGIAAAAGPLLGGWIIDNASWRWIFWINLPLAAAVLLISARHVPETLNPQARDRRFDIAGGAAGVVGLGGLTFAMIEAGVVATPYVVGSAVLGTAAMALFVALEHRAPNPLVPLRLFASRVFSVANGMTLLVYGALGAVMFFLILQLQVTTGFSPLEAGLSTVPITVFLLVLSSRSASLAARIGPRAQMTIGPVVCGAGVLLLHGVDETTSYVTGVLPGVCVFAFGLVTLVAPLTSTVLAAAPDRLAGTASGINNAVARTGSLLAVAALPAAVGMSGDDYQNPSAFSEGYQAAMLVCCALLVLGGLVSFLGLGEAEAPAGDSAEADAATPGSSS